MTSQLDQLRWQKFPVLDDGFVCLVDAMGDDHSVVEAARVSYAAGTRRTSDDRTLIRYLMRHWHTTPFEMAEIKLLVRVPMDCWRQWIRHRMASINETSTRYSVAIDAAQTTPADQWRFQAAANRQGSEGLLDATVGAELSAAEGELQQHARQVYEHRLQLGVAREQARKDLPLSTYTEAFWKVDLHNLLHFLQLRMDPARPVGDSPICRDDRPADRPPAVSPGLEGVCGLPAGSGTIEPTRPWRHRAAGSGTGACGHGGRVPGRRRSRMGGP